MKLIGVGQVPWTTGIVVPVFDLASELAGSVDIGMLNEQERAGRALANSAAAAFADAGAFSGSGVRSKGAKIGYLLSAGIDKSASVIGSDLRERTPKYRFPIPDISRGMIAWPQETMTFHLPKELKDAIGKDALDRNRSIKDWTCYQIEYMFAAVVHHLFNGEVDRFQPHMINVGANGPEFKFTEGYPFYLHKLYSAYRPDVGDQFGPIHGAKFKHLTEAVRRILADRECRFFDHRTGTTPLRSGLIKQADSPAFQDVGQALAHIAGELQARAVKAVELSSQVTLLTGERDGLRKDLDAKQKELEAKQTELSRAERSAGDRGDELAVANRQIEELKRTIAVLEERLGQPDERITGLEKKIAELEEAGRKDQAELTSLRLTLAEKEREIERLTDENAEVKESKVELGVRLREAVASLGALEKRLTVADAENKKLAAELAKAEARIVSAGRDLRVKNDALHSRISASSKAFAGISAADGPLVSLAKLISAESPDLDALRFGVLKLIASMTSGLSMLTGQPMGMLKRHLFEAVGDDVFSQAWVDYVTSKTIGNSFSDKLAKDLQIAAERVFEEFLAAIRRNEALGKKFHQGRAIQIVLDDIYAEFMATITGEYDKKGLPTGLERLFKDAFHQDMADFAANYLPEEFQLR